MEPGVERLRTGTGLANHHDVRRGRQEVDKALPHDGMIVGEHDADHACSPVASSTPKVITRADPRCSIVPWAPSSWARSWNWSISMACAGSSGAATYSCALSSM